MRKERINEMVKEMLHEVGSPEPLPPKIQNLKSTMIRKFVVQGTSGLGGHDDAQAKTTRADIESARYHYEYMKDNEVEPYVVRKANGFANYLAKKTIVIMPDEQLVGHPGRDPWYVPVNWNVMMWDRLVPGEKGHGALSKGALTPEEWQEFEQIMKYMDKFTIERNVLREIADHYPKEWMRYLYPPENYKAGFNQFYEQAFGATSNNLESFMGGLNAIKKKIQARIDEEDPLKVPFDQADKLLENIERRNNLIAMRIASDAVIDFAERYRKLALEMAAAEKDPIRKKELEAIAQNCDCAEPVTTFYGAVQRFWFEHFISHLCEQMGGSLSQRLDQTFYPYYKADIEAGRITRNQAKELLEEMCIKLERSMGVLLPQNMRSGASGSFLLLQNITLGGVDKHGRDATNDMTYLILETQRDMRCGQPTLSIRYHSGTPDELIVKSFEVLKTGLGMPAFFNDGPAIEHLLNRGWALEDARNNTVAGCVAFTCHGKNTMPHMPSAGAFNMAKCLEAAILDGQCIFDGEQYGLKTGDVKSFATYEDLVEAMNKQFLHVIYQGWTCSQTVIKWDKALLTKPFSSALSENAIKLGKDIKSAQDYSVPLFGVGTGMIDAIDSLAAIKKLVYDEKKVTWDQMVEAMRADWQGHEDIRKMCLDAPKFGSADPLVDRIAHDIFLMVDTEAAKFKDTLGQPYEVQYHSVSTFIPSGMKTGALPCGRKARSPLADGGISPEAGFGKEPTRVLRSVSAVDAAQNERMLLNMRLNPSTTPKQFVDLIRAWGDLKLSQIQFNMVRSETLRDAQKQPEKYPDLMVRVAGYSALWIDLTPNTQEAVISRAEQTLPAAVKVG
jgi:pyruvate-formate lyase